MRKTTKYHPTPGYLKDSSRVTSSSYSTVSPQSPYSHRTVYCRSITVRRIFFLSPQHPYRIPQSTHLDLHHVHLPQYRQYHQTLSQGGICSVLLTRLCISNNPPTVVNPP